MTQAEKLLLVALFGHVALVFILAAAMAVARVGAARRREVKIADVALASTAWPERVRKIGNNYNNQFELPVLLHVGILLTLVTHAADMALAGLALGFVALRLGHSAVHLGHNNVVHRFYVFGAGVFTLLGFWLWLGVRLFVTG